MIVQPWSISYSNRLKVKKRGLFFLGNGTSILNVADKLLELSARTGSAIYVLNYRGYGKSKGTPSFKTQFYDNEHFIASIQKQTGESFQFCIGYSLGSIFATYAAVDNQVGSLYLLSPFSNTKQLFAHAKKQNTKGVKLVLRPFIKVTAEEYLLRISNTEKLKQYHGKLVVFHGTKDKTLPYSMGQNLYNSYQAETKEFIPLINKGHDAAFESSNWQLLIQRLK